MSEPVIQFGQYGHTRTYTEVFSDEFSTDGAGPGPNFVYDTMDDALNRTGNSGMDENGNASGGSVPGKRWSAWYNGSNDSHTYRSGGKLYVGGDVLTASDPTRESYTHNGVLYDWSNYRFETSYLVTWRRVYSNDAGGHITDPASPNLSWGPGHYFELKVSFAQMASRGFRLSAWLMPRDDNASKAYDGDNETGAEIDIFEYENWQRTGFNAWDRIQMKVIAGAGGTTPGGSVDCTGYSLESGTHTIGLLWLEDGLHWYIDGNHVLQDLDRVPQCEQYLSITREINSGAKDSPGAGEIPSGGLKRPEDVGLYAVSAFLDKDKIPDDVGVIEYVKVWSVDGEEAPSTGGGSDPAEPTDPVETVSTLDPRLVIYTQPAIREGRPVQELTAVAVDGYETEGKTFTWSSSIPELTFSPQGSLVTTPSLTGLTAGQLATITIDDGED